MLSKRMKPSRAKGCSTGTDGMGTRTSAPMS